MVPSLINEYKLENNSKENFIAYRQKITRVLKKLEIWDKGNAIHKGNKTIMEFSQQQIQTLITSKEMHDYLLERSESDVIKKQKKYDETMNIIENRRNDYIDSITEQANLDPFKPVITNPFISNEQLYSVANSIMIKAIFEIFYSPLDLDRLLDNLTLANITTDELALTVENIEAEERLSHPEDNYYTRRIDAPKKNQNKRRFHRTAFWVYYSSK